VNASREGPEIPKIPVSSVTFEPRAHNVAKDFNFLKPKTYYMYHKL